MLSLRESRFILLRNVIRFYPTREVSLFHALYCLHLTLDNFKEFHHFLPRALLVSPKLQLFVSLLLLLCCVLIGLVHKLLVLIVFLLHQVLVLLLHVLHLLLVLFLLLDQLIFVLDLCLLFAITFSEGDTRGLISLSLVTFGLWHHFR